jgi:hypothetical protein
MSANFEEFRARKAAERSASPVLPGWVTSVGYAQVAFRPPLPGEYFYEAKRDKVMVCDAEETLPFAVVEYRGGPPDVEKR